MANLGKRNSRTAQVELPTNPPRIIAGRFRLEHQLGKGGNARVYYAIDEKTNHPVALKLFFRELEQDPFFVARFRKEVRIATNLHHPNIVRTIDYGYDSERYYLVMDYVDGSNLQELINERGPLELWQLMPILEQLCDALEYAHSQGIIHRDIKPHNVLLNSQEEVRLADFGLARAITSSGLTVTGPTLGTIGYIAPEQIQNGPLTQRTDIYSLGVLLFEMVTQRLPFENSSALAVALAHVQQEPPLPRIFNPAVSPGLELIIRRCMAKDPLRRYASVKELKTALQNCLAEEALYRVPEEPASAFLPDICNRETLAPRDNPLGDIISFTLPENLLKQYLKAEEFSGSAGKVAREVPQINQPEAAESELTATRFLPDEENKPFLSRTFESVPLDAITPARSKGPAWNGTGYARGKKHLKQIALASVLVLALIGLAVVSLVGLGLVNQTLVEAKNTPEAGYSSPVFTSNSNPLPEGLNQAPGLQISGRLSGVNFWRARDGLVLVTKDVVLGQDATLNIEPGTMVKFSQGAALRLEGGSLKAVGTPERPVLFSVEKSAGGVTGPGPIVASSSSRVRLENVLVSFGGGPAESFRLATPLAK
ncbi:MAG TPA: serine/threonine-protein kinase [Chloroflexia bacterium]|nr:serine/threonine-protein kinase [Chloroflexia bacterium]